MPFKHFVVRLPENASAKFVFKQYQQLLEETKNALQEAGAGSDYNLILVFEWLALIPRRSKGYGSFIANAANMVGLIWAKSDEVRDELMEAGLLNALAELGIPLESKRPSQILGIKS